MEISGRDKANREGSKANRGVSKPGGSTTEVSHAGAKSRRNTKTTRQKTLPAMCVVERYTLRRCKRNVKQGGGSVRKGKGVAGSRSGGIGRGGGMSQAGSGAGDQ